MHKNVFAARAPPRTRQGQLTALPRPLAGLMEGYFAAREWSLTILCKNICLRAGLVFVGQQRCLTTFSPVVL